MDFVGKIREYIEENQLLIPGDGVLVGVSGGVDSVVLLDVLFHLAREYGVKLTVAHLNHGLRGRESDRDAGFVGDVARSIGVPFYLLKSDIKDQAKEKRQNLQEFARTARFEFFLRVAGEIGASRIALGHNADDQAETVLMRLLRGAGTTGLVGISPSRTLSSQVNLIRPLLNCYRSDILEYAKVKELKWVEDKSNRQNKYLRNKIRNELLPFIIEHFNPDAVSDLVKISHICQSERTIQDDVLEGLVNQIGTFDSDEASLNRSILLGLPVATAYEILRSSIDKLQGSMRQLEYKHIKILYDFFNQPTTVGYLRQIHLPGLLVAERCKDHCRLTLATSMTEKREKRRPA